MDVATALAAGTAKLGKARIAGKPLTNTPSLDAGILLSHASGLSTETLRAHPEKIADSFFETYSSFLERRLTGEPVAYITGSKEFWGRDFVVTPAVLIPKPDTEILVERAFTILKEQSNQPAYILDACTGSGCIAITLAAACRNASISAFDISPEALDVAQTNAQTILAPDLNIHFYKHDLFNGIPQCKDGQDGQYTLIVSNPPYVPSETAQRLLEDGRNEPLLALDGGSDGLDMVKAIIDNCPDVLTSGGHLLVETGEYNAVAASEYLKTRGFIDILIHTDLEGQYRVIEGVQP